MNIVACTFFCWSNIRRQTHRQTDRHQTHKHIHIPYKQAHIHKHMKTRQVKLQVDIAILLIGRALIWKYYP